MRLIGAIAALITLSSLSVIWLLAFQVRADREARLDRLQTIVRQFLLTGDSGPLSVKPNIARSMKEDGENFGRPTQALFIDRLSLPPPWNRDVFVFAVVREGRFSEEAIVFRGGALYGRSARFGRPGRHEQRVKDALRRGQLPVDPLPSLGQGLVLGAKGFEPWREGHMERQEALQIAWFLEAQGARRPARY